VNNFFAEKIDHDKLLLSPEESWHCARVLRLKSGQKINALNGNGIIWEAELSTVHDKQTTAIIINEILVNKRDFVLHLAVAPVKNSDRLEWLIEKIIELGVEKITFLLCKNSERKSVNLERLNKIVESAVKQSGQAFKPILSNIEGFTEFIKSQSTLDANKLIAHCFPTEKITLSSCKVDKKNIIFLIGPEGDFRDDEVKLALGSDFIPVSLGNSRLRTETAAVHAVSYFRTILQ
jgi:16S rRNA (uracil1498-N3)-methyltransferase